MATETTLLVDGDQYCYKASAALERPIDWGDGIHTLHADDREGREMIDLMLERLKDQFQADRMVICLTSLENNFRREVYPQYKEQRQGLRRPMILHALREHIKSAYEFREMSGLEADDIMGIMATRRAKKSKYIIVSDDKDMLQIPGVLYQPGHSDLGLQKITPEEGDNFFYTQVLCGDRADNYPGCPGVGVAKAAKILDTDDKWAAVVKAYKERGLTEQDALVQARVARILRSADFDFNRRKPKLWSPNGKH